MYGAHERWPHLNFTDFFLRVKLIQDSKPLWTGIFRKHSANFINVRISYKHCRRPNMSQDGILWSEKEQHLPTSFLPSRMCVYKHCNKSSLEHMPPPSVSVTSIQPTCSLWPARTHMLRKTTEMRGGPCWQADQGQQGLFDQWRGPSGHWALTAYATALTYTDTNPHFISHICSVAQNKLTIEFKKKNRKKRQLCKWTNSKKILRNWSMSGETDFKKKSSAWVEFFFV